jgi:ABC-type Fe3+/spermidine/putrescine transport system ATPase subunit
VTFTHVALTEVTKQFGDTAAVDDLTTRVEAGSFTALLGPSGCGKSTTLALIAGLLPPDSGEIRFDGRSVHGVPAEQRPTGLVFQKPLLFPHLSVEQNVAFGLRMRRVNRGEARRRVHAMLERVQLADLGPRQVGELSGGQEQRVALARALVLEPKVMLLDEPFSQLDANLRVEMRTLVRALHDESKVTTLFVTHDQAEAIDVADSITLMLDGRQAGHGDPQMFYTRPPSLAAARFFGVTNEITGSVSTGRFLSDDGRLCLPVAVPPGNAVLVIRPEALRLTADPGPTTLEGVTVSARFAVTHLAIDVQVGCDTVLAVHAPVGTPVELGTPVRVQLPPTACSVFPGSPL